MNNQELYYTPPSDKAFEDMKSCAIKIWRTYDDTHGYATSKIDKIKDLDNAGGNFMYIYAMFDWQNQAKIAMMLDKETVIEATRRLV